MLNLPAALLFSSTLSFTTFSFPACSRATSSTVGESMWHGRHQSAQKSTITGWILLASITSASKLASVTAWRISDMVSSCGGLPANGRFMRPYLDDPTTRGIRALLAASYSVTYAAAEAFHEKSLAMP